MSDIVELLKTVGFPAAIAVYLLVRLDKQIAKMSAQLNQMIGILRVKAAEDEKEGE